MSADLKATRFNGADGVMLAADVGGDVGRPGIVLMHGGGQTRQSWGRALTELIAAGYHVVSLDLRGHGDSDRAPDGDYRFGRFVADLREVLKQLPPLPALVGASLGGLTGLLAVGESKQPIASGLVLVDVVPKVEREGTGRIHAFMTGNPDGFATLDEAADAVAAYLPHRPRPRNTGGLKRNLRLHGDGRWHWHWDPAFVTGDLRPETHRIVERMREAAQRVQVPTLLVRGAISDVVSVEAAQDFLSLLPSAEFLDVAGAGHMVAGDDNDAFNAAVLDFLHRRLPA
ncbi:MAG: alpha/beta hydrolase [Hydrocarboniphaga sp.]|uniref:alpha/beta fold hydrolase n=1 Tax=Hydrocarboniphaga sp. TaxID=2033016 RepID=UPI002624DF9D|nr:alpha/beta hydrolase [Hydrocarboniphaga sp.]MDB5970228.1 alpha/beta hydrolase [Hydrocarboniphaga sp.]